MMTPRGSASGPLLEGLQVLTTAGGSGELTPAFSADVRSYTIRVQSDIKEIRLIPTAAAGVEEITVDGSPVESGKGARAMDDLVVTESRIDGGPMMKRINPGRGARRTRSSGAIRTYI